MNTIKKSLIYSLAESYLCVVIQIASSMVIARLLTPTEIGKFSVGVAALSIAHMIRDFGVGTYIVQTKELSKQDIKASFGIAIVIAWSLALTLFLCRNLIVDFYHEPALSQIMTWMSINFIIIPFSSTVYPLLTREMKFNLLFYINLVPSLLSSVVSIYFAYAGYGYMSLAWGSCVNILLAAIMATCLRPSYSFVLPSLKGCRHILSYGGKISLSNVLSQIGMNVAELAIGKIQGFASVALFSKAQSVISMFSQQFLGSISKVYYPVISQHYRDNKPVNIAFKSACAYISAIAFPFYAFIALHAEDIILFMFGNQWLTSVKLIQILTIGGCIHSMNIFTTPTLNALGRPNIILKAEIIVQFFQVITTLTAAFISLEMVAWAQVATQALSLFVYLFLLSRLIGLRILLLVLRLLFTNALIVGGSMLLPLYLKLYPIPGLPSLALIALACLSFCLSWVIMIFLTKNPIRQHIAQLFNRAASSSH